MAARRLAGLERSGTVLSLLTDGVVGDMGVMSAVTRIPSSNTGAGEAFSGFAGGTDGTGFLYGLGGTVGIGGTGTLAGDIAVDAKAYADGIGGTGRRSCLRAAFSFLAEEPNSLNIAKPIIRMKKSSLAKSIKNRNFAQNYNNSSNFQNLSLFLPQFQ